ncbi:hypothetical protein KR009_007638 [Drosophila setifemur]|nr:hypothetical protein KR009_007638 [Drosophila setifemur]
MSLVPDGYLGLIELNGDLITGSAPLPVEEAAPPIQHELSRQQQQQPNLPPDYDAFPLDGPYLAPSGDCYYLQEEGYPQQYQTEHPVQEGQYQVEAHQQHYQEKPQQGQEYVEYQYTEEEQPQQIRFQVEHQQQHLLFATLAYQELAAPYYNEPTDQSSQVPNEEAESAAEAEEFLQYQQTGDSKSEPASDSESDDPTPPAEERAEADRQNIFLKFASGAAVNGERGVQVVDPEEEIQHRLASCVTRCLQLIGDYNERLPANTSCSDLSGIQFLRYKVVDVISVLLREAFNGQDTPHTWSLFKDIFLWFKEQNRLGNAAANGSQQQEQNDEVAIPMGLDLLNRLRHFITGWHKPKESSLGPGEAGSGTSTGIGNGAGLDYQSDIRNSARKRRNPEDDPRLIKYRRVDNSFPRFISNEAAEDRAPFNSMAERERERQRQHSKRLSIFNSPPTTQQRVRNHAQTSSPIDLSDDEEHHHQPFANGSAAAASGPPVLERPSSRTYLMSEASSTSAIVRPQILYSDALRLGQNGYGETRVNGHSEDSMLAVEEQRSEREQYRSLIRNLCYDKSVVQPSRSSGSTWSSLLNANRVRQHSHQLPPSSLAPPLHPRPPPPVNAHQNQELEDYAKLLNRGSEVKKHEKSAKLVKAASGRASTSSSSESCSGESYSSVESVVITNIDDSSNDEQGSAVANRSRGVVESSSSQNHSLTTLFNDCVFFKDGFAEHFKQASRRHRQEVQHRQNLALAEAEKSRNVRRAYESDLREKIFKYRLVHKPIFVIGDSQKAPEEKTSDFIALTEEHLRRYNDLIQGPPQQVLVSKFNLNISRNDIRTLLSGNWLNDEVINFYMNMLTDRSERRAGELPSVYAMNTFFVPRLLQNGHGGVKRWTRKVDLFSKDIIPVPVHCNGVHWCMAIIHMRDRTIRYYDSMGKPNQEVLDALEAYLQSESLDKRKQPFDTSGFQIHSVPNVPQQTNGSDCGVFSCMFAEYVTRDQPLSFSQEQMDYFRKKMALEICGGELWL